MRYLKNIDSKKNSFCDFVSKPLLQLGLILYGYCHNICGVIEESLCSVRLGAKMTPAKCGHAFEAISLTECRMNTKFTGNDLHATRINFHNFGDIMT